MMTDGSGFSALLMGDETLLVQCADLLIRRRHRIVGIVSGSEAIGKWAAERGLRVFAPTPEGLSSAAALDFCWFLSIGNLRMVPKTVWGRAGKGAINFHDGPLPRYAGLNTPVWALLAGETQHGITWHEMTETVDAGTVYVREPVDISADDTALTLNMKCFEAGVAGFEKLVARIEAGPLVGETQDLTQRTYFAKSARPEGAATLDFTAPLAVADRLLRALNFGAGHANPLAVPKIRMATRGALFVTAARTIPGPVVGAPGLVTALGADGSAEVAAVGGRVVIGALHDGERPIVPADVLTVGAHLTPAPASPEFSTLQKTLARHEDFFVRRLSEVAPLRLEAVRPAEGPPAARILPVAAPAFASAAAAVGGLAAVLARLQGGARLLTGFVPETLSSRQQAFPGYVAPQLPLSIELPEDASVRNVADAVAEELVRLGETAGYAADLPLRRPGVAQSIGDVAIRVVGRVDDATLVPGSAVTLAIRNDGGAIACVFDSARLAEADARALARQFGTALAAAAQQSDLPVTALPLVPAEELHVLISDRNRTDRAYDRTATVVSTIEAQVDRTPELTALVAGADSLTYRQLDERANRVAAGLVARGIGPDVLVGLYMKRSCDLVVAALAVLKAGGAYVPLDPTYPADRIGLMVSDSRAPLVLADEDLVSTLPAGEARALTLADAARGQPADRLPRRARPESLAYVIYTSGSTGRPKGVMVEHGNVTNFFAGMDDRIPMPGDNQPVWLAVTSLSFDISVLELFWTLSRGFKVVVHANDRRKLAASAAPRRTAREPGGMDFSLFYWGNDDGPGPQKYQLLLEGAKFADANGFRAVWTPERHFHAFGGPYPNPSISGAAVAAVTRNLDIRAGSCVLPLHHPARVAEEWAFIDNLSNGRAGLAFASGWMPEDFILRPENAPPHNKAAMFRDIEVVRRLWRGEKVAFQGPTGTVDVVTQPRPVQPELPVWVTTAGNPDTYREAARAGAHVLTHLLGQSIAELADKIRIYRETLVECGRDPSAYTVTLMLHTLVGEDREEVRDLAREPMKAYLRSAAALIKQYAWAFPAFKKPQGVSQPMQIDLQTLTPEELDAILEFAFLRYFDDSGLFGTVADATARADELKAIGVNEIACLIDFGAPREVVMAGLPPLAEVLAASNPAVPETVGDADESIGGLIRRHGVTHLQCTPSMASLILMDDDDRSALAGVRHLFIGGEALQGTLVRELRAATSATLMNMYGPTETTIWSSTADVAADVTGAAPLGTPIANTQLYILDDRLRPVPLGTAGELFIAGDGVTRGYLNREELTRERFLDDPFRPGNRMYRTGDLVRIDEAGALQFLGRADFQVKVRGYRIELGEIEARIGTHPAVAEAVVVAREDAPGDLRLVAYVRWRAAPATEDDVRAHVRAELPDFMVPAHVVTMDAFPLTPNAKVDRKALPRPGSAMRRSEAATATAAGTAAPVPAFIAPASEIQAAIADAFRRALGVERIGTLDNFFALGGHSLLAVQVHRDLKDKVAPGLTITDIYRFPTVGGLAEHLASRGKPDQQLSKVADRAQMRRNALAGRRAGGATREAS